jgi:hypothetical protein
LTFDLTYGIGKFAEKAKSPGGDGKSRLFKAARDSRPEIIRQFGFLLADYRISLGKLALG